MYHLSVWLHLVATAVWIGGMVFFAAVLLPVARRHFPERAMELVERTGVRFRWLSWLCLAVLAATGVTNLVYRGVGFDRLAEGGFWVGPFGRALALKLLVVTALFGLSAVHDFDLGPRAGAAWRRDPDSTEARTLRRVAAWIGRANLFLALLAVAAGVMLVRGWPL